MVAPTEEKLSEAIKVSIQNGLATIEHSDAYLAQRDRFLAGERFTRAEMAANERLIKSEDMQMAAAQQDPAGFLRQQQQKSRQPEGHEVYSSAQDAKDLVQRLRADFSAAGLTAEQQTEIMQLMAQNARKNAVDKQASTLQGSQSARLESDAEPVKSAALPPPLDIQRAVVGDGVKQFSAGGSVKVDGGGLAGSVDYAQGFKHLQAGVGLGANDQGVVDASMHAEKVIPLKDIPVAGDAVLYPYGNVRVAGLNSAEPALAATVGALVVKTGELDLGLGEKNAVAGYVGAQSNQEGHVNAYVNGSIALTRNLTLAAGPNYDVAAANLTESLEVLYQANRNLQFGAKVTTDEGKGTAIAVTTNYRFGEGMER